MIVRRIIGYALTVISFIVAIGFFIDFQLNTDGVVDIQPMQSDNPKKDKMVTVGGEKFNVELKLVNISSPFILPVLNNINIYYDYLLLAQNKKDLTISICPIDHKLQNLLPDKQLKFLTAGNDYEFEINYKEPLDNLLEIENRLKDFETIRLLRINVEYNKFFSQTDSKFNKYYILTGEKYIWDIKHDENNLWIKDPSNKNTMMSPGRLIEFLNTSNIVRASLDATCWKLLYNK
jgi:hypothetical protein